MKKLAKRWKRKRLKCASGCKWSWKLSRKKPTLKKNLNSEKERLTSELKKIIERCEQLRDQKSNLLTDLEKDKINFEKEDVKLRKGFKENISFLSQKLKALRLKKKKRAKEKNRV